MGHSEKTNVMRILDQKKISYNAFEYSPEITEGTVIAEILGENEKQVFKTLVTESGKGSYFVFVIPVGETLDLKAAAKAVGTKSISMLKQKELLSLTGYIHGGCSPVGMKKQFVTVFDESAKNFSSIFVSAGKVGRQIEVKPEELSKLVNGSFSRITLAGQISNWSH